MSETKWYDKNHSKTPGALQGRDKDGQFTEDTIENSRSEAQENNFKESKAAKEYKISQKQLNSIPSYYFKDFKVTTVNIEDLVGNAIKDKNAGVYQRRSERWGKTLEDYHYDEEKDDWKYEPIMIDGSGKLIDGNHRLLALYNDGYRTAEVLAPKSYKNEQKQAMKLFGLNKGE